MVRGYRPPLPVIERLENKTSYEGDCWRFTGPGAVASATAGVPPTWKPYRKENVQMSRLSPEGRKVKVEVMREIQRKTWAA